MVPRKAGRETSESLTNSPLLLGSTRLRSGPFDNFPVGTLTRTEGNEQPPERLWYSPAGRKPRALSRQLPSGE
jgi:hypothetical protein